MQIAKEKYFPADKIELVRSGADYFDRMISMIHHSTKTIHLQTYIFAYDIIGKKILAALIEASVRNVEVNVLCDSFGSADFKKEIKNTPGLKNIHLRFFSPAYLSAGFRAGRRLHHKVFVVDDKEAIVGGINISDNYAGTPTEKEWLDFAVYIQGTICLQLTKICIALLNNKYKPSFSNKTRTVNQSTLVRFCQSDYIRGKRQITLSYRNAIRSSRKEIILINAYFLPGIRLKSLLQKASKRGVKIKLILSANSDVPFIKRAMNYYYQWLFRNNIEVYEYQPTVLHAKAAMYDNELASIGSFNLNYLSEYISIELNADIVNKNFTENFKTVINQIIENDCKKISIHTIHEENISSRLLDTSAYYLLSISQSFLFFITRKDKVNELSE
ncbi:MAG: phospholipase D-like domain-containing protein [Pseudomonadota bacterium]